MKKLLKFCNDNHWFIIAGLLGIAATFWTFGCVSTVDSVVNPGQQVNKLGLDNELQYLIGLVKIRAEELKRQDETTQSPCL